MLNDDQPFQHDQRSSESAAPRVSVTLDYVGPTGGWLYASVPKLVFQMHLSACLPVAVRILLTINGQSLEHEQNRADGDPARAWHCAPCACEEELCLPLGLFCVHRPSYRSLGAECSCGRYCTTRKIGAPLPGLRPGTSDLRAHVIAEVDARAQFTVHPRRN